MISYNDIHKAADALLKMFEQQPNNRLSESSIETDFRSNGLANYWRQALNTVLDDELIKADSKTGTYYILTNKGSVFINNGYYEKDIERKKEAEIALAQKEALEDKKLTIDLANAERVYKTYPFTRFAAISALICSLILLILKILEAFDIWPYNR